MFAGTPDLENYIKNLTDASIKRNPYLNPTMIANAVQIDVKSEELKNYKVRGLADNAIICEGYCILPHERVKAVQLVPDLIRNSDGSPVIDKKTGEPLGVRFRERTEKEIMQSPTEYFPSKDYLEYMEQKRVEYGYAEGKNILAHGYNLLKTLKCEGELEGNTTIENTRNNFVQAIKNIFNRATKVQIDENADAKIDRLMGEFNFDKKNPYRDSKFGLAVAKFQQQGLTQLELRPELEALIHSKEGQFFSQKAESLDKSPIRKKGIHGIAHNNRVAMHAMLIAKYDGILENDSDNRIKDILLTAAYYHDIGRIGNNGPHSKRSARLVDKLDLRFEDGTEYSDEDRNLLKMLVEGHEGKDKDFERLAKKYQIHEDKKEQAKKMLFIIKDADALDRVRIDTNTSFRMKTNLDPSFLRTDTSKRLLNVSYELESLTKKVDFRHVLLYKTDSQVSEHKNPMQIQKEKFENGIKVELSKLPEIPRKIKRTLSLCRENMTLFGNGMKDKMKQILKSKKDNKGKEETEQGIEK